MKAKARDDCLCVEWEDSVNNPQDLKRYNVIVSIGNAKQVSHFTFKGDRPDSTDPSSHRYDLSVRGLPLWTMYMYYVKVCAVNTCDQEGGESDPIRVQRNNS